VLTRIQLRAPCIELSSVALQFRGQRASTRSVLQALEAVHAVVLELGHHDVLDEKLAEYAFFPLSNVFNESQSLSSRCLEIAVQSLQVLISRGWRQKLHAGMGKQLLILLSLLAGGSAARPKDNPPSDELICACFECMSSIFDYLGQDVFDETGATTIVDQNVYLLLEVIMENPSEHVQFSAAKTLQALLNQIGSRVVLASLLPRTVSALTKALKPNTQTRRTYKVLVICLELLSHILPAVLADEVAACEAKSENEAGEVLRVSIQASEQSGILDDKWLRATVAQVKLALANVVKIRSHNRSEVQHALFKMCLIISENCTKTLSDSMPFIIETMTMVADRDEVSPSTREKQMLRQLVLSKAQLTDSMRNSLDAWINALPRVMQGNDDRPKQQILRQIATAFQILTESGDVSDRLEGSLASSLVQTVSEALATTQAGSIRTISEASSPGQMIHLQEQKESTNFEPVMMDQRSQLGTLTELHFLIRQVKDSFASAQFTRSIMERIGQSSSSQQLSALWLTLNLLTNDKSSFSMSDLVDLPEDSIDATPYLISDLYSLTLPLLLDSSMTSNIHDWRIPALALESTILQANQLGSSYRPELIDTLYPILSLLGSPEPRLRSHAMTGLNLLAVACGYSNTSTMLVENVDYLINSIALKLNTYDISPQGPQVLLMLLRLCGARLIPYLDDLVGSIFAALDNFHGYPRLVELLFEVLGVAVDEAAKNPTSAITRGMEEPRHRKTASRPSTMEDILQDLRAHKERKERRKIEMLGVQADDDAPQSTPHRPWTSKQDGPQSSKQDHERQDADFDETEVALSNLPEEGKEKPLSKAHTLLLSIARSTIPHLSSPSSRVRLTLLQLLTRITPLLARHENSFLPLVNDVWPVILPRLFTLESKGARSREPDEPEDPAYVTIAAADTISEMCIGVGDFMSSRIEAIFPHLERMYRQVWNEVEQDRQRMAQYRGSAQILAISSSDDSVSKPEGANLRGAVDLRIINSPFPATSSDITPTTKATNPPTTPSYAIQHHHRTTALQIHTSLLHLLTTILLYVHIPPSLGDAILTLLGSIMDEPGREYVREALEVWNADAVWVVRGQLKIEREMVQGVREWGDWRWNGKVETPAPAKVKRERGDGEIWEFEDVVF
jgi:TELO2-interacting protein 1